MKILFCIEIDTGDGGERRRSKKKKSVARGNQWLDGSVSTARPLLLPTIFGCHRVGGKLILFHASGRSFGAPNKKKIRENKIQICWKIHKKFCVRNG